MKLSRQQQRIFRRIQRKYNVSVAFLLYNMANIRKFIWYAMCPRLVIKRMAVRRQPSQRVVIEHNRLRRVLFDQAFRKLIKRRKRNVQEWSRRMVRYLKSTIGAIEYVEEEFFGKATTVAPLPPDEVSKQLKQQLELLKSGKRTVPLMDSTKTNLSLTQLLAEAPELRKPDVTPEKQIVREELSNSIHTLNELYHQRRTADSSDERTVDYSETLPDSCESMPRLQTGVNFLDMLMRKVNSTNPSTFNCLRSEHNEHEHSLSSSEDFLGFDERAEYPRVPGLLQTPVVGEGCNADNSAFVSQSLDDYLLENELASAADTTSALAPSLPTHRHQRHVSAAEDGLVTPACQPPFMCKPAVPESLQNLRTVAERRSYLQRFARNHKLAIINNEAAIYRELQRRLRRQLRSKPHAIVAAQAAGSQLPFTRAGWRAASFITTDCNKFYYQKLLLDQGRECVRLPGVRGNNDDFYQPTYESRPQVSSICGKHCLDAFQAQQLKSLPTRAKLNSTPLPALFRACPLSKKPFQKPLDEETAALLLAGGSMAVVRMPGVDLEVMPAVGKPLHEVAKRYLQYILPHHDITREWAEFSVSTIKQGEQLAAAQASGERRSFTFAIPYMHDRSQILVRRVVDRSEALDKSFKAVAQGLEPTEAAVAALSDLSFRAKLDSTDEELLTCADVVSDLINSVAISCSENSFIQHDPDALNGNDDEMLEQKSSATPTLSKSVISPKQDGNPRSTIQNKKQNRLV